MSMYLDFEPHSWYMGFAIRHYEVDRASAWAWVAVIADGMTNTVDEVMGNTLDELKANIRDYHIQAQNGYGERIGAR